jgi:uncharacterized protein (TIGR02246 family)
MKHPPHLLALCLLGTAVGLAHPSPQETELKNVRSSTAASGQDEHAVRDLVADFEKRFNAGDASALAALFTENARLVTLEGQVVEGRANIEALFATAFEETPGQTIALETHHLRFLNPEAAIEEGTATIQSRSGPALGKRPAETTRYTVAYVKRDGKWLHDYVRDEPPPQDLAAQSPADQLQQLEWLLGEWIDESDHAHVETTCRWADNRAFLVREFQVKIQGQPAMEGTQRIGWDPRLKQFRSWVFDSEGGFSEGIWTHDGERWVVKTMGVMKDGRTVTATNAFIPESRDRIRWVSTDRTLGDEVLPNSEEVVLVRRPPGPGVKPPSPPPAQPQR